MTGIYMYTNKVNNKKYVGQSIHCGKRFDQHFKGKQLIDDIIQLEGIENFNFEILKQVDKSELSYWEDYYILKHNTMFPNGYNRKWNCSAAIREQIGEVLEEEEKPAAEATPENSEILKRVPAAIKGDEDFLKLTSKQLLVFYWLISKSYWEEGTEKDFYFLYRDTIDYSQMGKDLGIKSARNTISSALEKLKQNGKIEMTENLIEIPFPKSYTYLHIDLIRFLLAESIKVGGNLLLFYSILKRKWELNNENGESTSFGLKSIVKTLGHNVNDSNEYKKIRDYIKLLKDWKLIEVSEKESTNKGGVFMEYRVERIEEALKKRA